MMKIRFRTYFLILLLAALAVVVGLRSVKQKVNLETMQTAIEPTNDPAVNGIIPNNVKISGASPTNPQLPAPSFAASNEGAVDPRELQMQQAFEAKNVPINFYGQVFDQDNHPIPSVRVKIHAEHVFYLISQGISSTNIEMETLTDSAGRFEWTSKTGDLLAIETITKDGYLLSPNAPHNFVPSSGSFESPVIFKMWKEGAKEPLISGSHVYGIDSGKTYTLDLVGGKKILGEGGGDLRVSIKRPADAKPRVNFLWSFSIEVIGGGLLESDDEFMYLAPESGYEPKLEMQFDPSDSNWTGVVNKRFFIRARNGQVYGRVQVEVDAIYNVHSAIQINYTINPNGSRNLQP